MSDTKNTNDRKRPLIDVGDVLVLAGVVLVLVGLVLIDWHLALVAGGLLLMGLGWARVQRINR